MHPRQAALLTDAAELTEKLADKEAAGSPVLWQYKDEDGRLFFLPNRMQNVHSPYTGKSSPQRPEKYQIPAVGKELREQAAPGAPGPKSGAPKAKPKRKASDLEWKVQSKA